MYLLKVLLITSPVIVTTLILTPNIKQHSKFSQSKFILHSITNLNHQHANENIFSLPHATKTALETMMDKMIQYFGSMVDLSSKKFFLVCYPQSSEGSCRMHQQCSLRELGCVWDATTALQWLSAQKDDSRSSAVENLQNAILTTLEKYSTFTTYDNRSTLHFDVLKEKPNIAHNGLFLIGLMGTEIILKDNTIDEIIKKRIMNLSSSINVNQLTKGILSMQRKDGAFRTYFHSSNDNTNNNDVYKGIEFFSGEAMTALLEVYSSSKQQSPHFMQISNETTNQILPAMKLALKFYYDYYDKGRMDGTVDVNYTIWQIQAFSRLFFVLLQEQREKNYNQDGDKDEMVIADSASYCFDMCNDIIKSASWRMLSRGKSFYPNLSTIEIACGLDALIQGTHVVAYYTYYHLKDDDEKSLYYDKFRLFVRNVENAIEFLKWSQDRIVDDSQIGYGGLGFGGVYITEQRLDVTGHALSAVFKLLNLLEDEP